MVPTRSEQRKYMSSNLSCHIKADPVIPRVVHPTWVRTPLIELLIQRKDFNEFILEASTVADEVVGQILKAESAQLILPGRYNLVPGLRVLPGWMQASMRNSVAKMLRNPGS